MSDDSDCEHKDSGYDDDGENLPNVGSHISMLTWHGIREEAVLPDKKQEQLADQFSLEFFKRYPSSELLFCRDSLGQTIRNSLLHPVKPMPLILYIHHDQAIAANIFSRQIFHSEVLVQYLNEEFTVWPWDRTHTNNYHHLLLLIDTHFGHEVALQVASYADSIDSHPLLVSIGSRGDRFEIRNIIEDTTSPDRVFETLVDMNINFYADMYPMDRSLHPLWYRISDSMIGGSLENLTKQLHAFIGHLIDIKDGENNIVPFPGVLSVAKPTGTYLMVGCSHTLAQGLMKDGFPRSIEHAVNLHCTARSTSLQTEKSAVLICRVDSDHANTETGFVTYGSVATAQNMFLDLLFYNVSPLYLISYRD